MIGDKTYIILADEQGAKRRTEPMASDMPLSQIPYDTQPKTAPAIETTTTSINAMGVVATGMALNAAKSASNLALSSVGMITGDSLKQQRVNDGLKLAGYAASVATLNPVIIGAAAISFATEAAGYAVKESHRRKLETIAVQNAEQYQRLSTTQYGRGRR